MYAEKHLGLRFLGKYYLPAMLIINAIGFAIALLFKNHLAEQFLWLVIMSFFTVSIFLPILIGKIQLRQISHKHGKLAESNVKKAFNNIDDINDKYYPDIGDIIAKSK